MAMYQSKSRGRAASTVYAQVAHDPLERLSLPARLRRAIAEDELVLYYQPIVELPTGGSPAMEALLRWNDPDRGLVYPDAFIPAAEEMSLLEPIGDWVIGALAQQILEWREEGLEPHVSFNVSPRQLHRPGLRGRADRAAGEPGHRPGVADDGADGIGHAARARADRADPARARRERPADGDRRLRRRLVLALAAARAAGALAQDRPLVHARDPRRPRTRARSSTP